MNRCYRLIWNRATGTVQVASELVMPKSGAQAASQASATSRHRPLAKAMFAALIAGACLSPAIASAAQSYSVTQASDDGTGTVVGSLSWAILQANANPGSTIAIELNNGSITETGTLPTLDGATITGLLNITGPNASPLPVQNLTLGNTGQVWGGNGSDGANGANSNGSDAGAGSNGGLGVGALIVQGSGQTSNTVTNNDGISGGLGGSGGYGGEANPSNDGTHGGNGGAGGNGGNGGTAITGNNFTLIVNYAINLGQSSQGGKAGAGGGSFLANGGNGGNGGDGGNGINGTNFAVTNNSGIYGGAAGTSSFGGSGMLQSGSGGRGGEGGIAISGTHFTLSNTSTIQGGSGSGGGMGGDGLGGNNGGNGGTGGTGGNGGDAVTGNQFAVTNDGSSMLFAIQGGQGGDGGTGGNGGGASSGTGAGGQGGNGGNGGNGGTGGNGVSGTAFTLTNSPHSSVSGGNGGWGAGPGVGGYSNGNPTVNGLYGHGGNGGNGVAGSGFDLTNAGTINGGDGGKYYTSGSPNAAFFGNGGSGVSSTGGASITTSGNIAGGKAGGTGAQANAVSFSGGGNTLTLVNGYSFGGNVASTSAAGGNGDTLALGGDSNGTFNVSNIVATLPSTATSTQYVGFAHFAKTGASTWTLIGAGATNENWTISGGTLRGDVTALAGDIAFAPASGQTAAVEFDQGSANTNSPANATYAKTLSGNGALIKGDNGTLTLTGANTYTGGTTINAGTLQIGAGGTAGAIAGNVSDNGALAFNRSDAVSFAGTIAGTGSLIQAGTGTLTLDGNSGNFSGATTVASGTLVVGSAANNGAALGGNLTVNGGATLGGYGNIGGDVGVLAGGIVAPGGALGTLKVAGNFSAAQGSQLNFAYGAPGANFQTFGNGNSMQVGGNLALNGTTLDVANAGAMGPGLYNVFTYGGTLTETNGGLLLGTTPAGQTLQLQSLAAQKQINLIDGSAPSLGFWNANDQASASQMGGGNGTWSTTAPNWTNATGSAPNGAMQPQPGFAVFGGAAGTVTIDDGNGHAEPVSATGMQFATSGYALAGDSLALVANNGATPIIRVGNGSSAGTGMVATINDVLTGTAGLDKADLGTLVLTAANTISGGVTISGGTLSVASDTNLGAASNTLALDGGSVEVTGRSFSNTTRNITLGANGGGIDIDDAANTFTLSQGLGGAGALNKGGAGALILTAANTYSGGTAILSGTLQIGSANTSGSIIGNVIDNGTLAFDRSDSVSFAGVISGTGALAQRGNGTLILTGANTYSGGTAIEAGTLQIGAGGTTGTLQGNIIDNSTLVFDHSDNVNFAGAIAGTGSLVQQGSGTLILTGTNTYTGGTTILSGTLQVGDGTSGSISGNVSNDGVLVFDTGNNANFSGTISGSGSVVLEGNGSMTLAGANTYTGGTTMQGGALVFDSSNDTTFSSAIAGTGSLIQQGSGLLVLDGQNSTFAGTTIVQAGTLEVGDAATPTAILGGNVAIAHGGTLRGHGTISGNVDNGGTVWAGGSLGTLTIKGNYTQTANGIFKMEATPAGQASQLDVTGTASLAGSALVLADTGNWALRTDYTVLNAAGGINGQFASASSSLAFLTPVLAYGAHAVTLSLQRNGLDFASVARTPNQAAVAGVVGSLGTNDPIFNALVVLDAPTARRAFDQLGGEIHASTRTAVLDDDRLVRDAIAQHLAGIASGTTGRQASSGDVTAWTSVWGHWGSLDGNGNASRLSANGSGLVVGADLAAGSDTRVGAMIGTGQGTARIAALGSSSHTLDKHLGVYGSTLTGPLQWQGGAVYGWQQVDANRIIGFNQFEGVAHSDYRAHTAQAYLDGSWPIVRGATTLAPFAYLAYESLRTPGITETGTSAALQLAAQNSGVGFGTVGLRANFDLGAPGHGLHAYGSLGWQHAWGDLTPIASARFASGGSAFEITGIPVANDAASVDGGISFAIAPSITVNASYHGQFGKHAADQSGRIGLDWRF